MKDCSTNSCSYKKCIISVAAVFIFTFLFDWLVHGVLLMDIYEQTPSIWRPDTEMQAMLPWCLAFHFLMALVVTCMFKNYKNYSPAACAADPELAKKCTPCARGICFGVHLGLIFGLGMFASYIWLPVSLSLGAAWFLSGLLKGLGIGLILSCACGKKDVA